MASKSDWRDYLEVVTAAVSLGAVVWVMCPGLRQTIQAEWASLITSYRNRKVREREISEMRYQVYEMKEAMGDAEGFAARLGLD